MSDLPRIALIDQIRGLAALSVAWFHFTSGSEGWLRETGRYGFLGVDAFFVVSGLVIPYFIVRSFPDYGLKDYSDFLLSRILRLEPTYIFSILTVISLSIIATKLTGFQGENEGLLDPFRIAAHIFYIIPLTDYAWFTPVY